MRPIGDLLGHVHDVGRHAKGRRAGIGAHAAKAGNHFVKNQQDVVGRADFAQAGQVAHRRNHHPGGTRHGLHYDSRNVGRVVQCNQLEQLVGQLRTRGWHALEKRTGGGLGVGQVVGFDALTEGLSVAKNAADRDAAEIDTVVAFFPPDQAGFGALALGTPVGARHFERGVGGFGARAGEKHVVQSLGS